MRRVILGITLAALLLACGGKSGSETAQEALALTTTTTIPEYPPFSDVDPHTSLYFVTLEDTGLAESQGPERLYNLGVNVCQRLDAGQSIEENLADDAGLGDQMGAVLGAAVTDLCPQHGPKVEEYLAENP